MAIELLGQRELNYIKFYVQQASPHLKMHPTIPYLISMDLNETMEIQIQDDKILCFNNKIGHRNNIKRELIYIIDKASDII